MELKEDYEDEGMFNSEQISELMAKNKPLDELTSLTSFGSIRLDKDNKPQLNSVGEQSILNEDLGKSFLESNPSQEDEDLPRDYLGLPVHDSNKFDKFSAFQSHPAFRSQDRDSFRKFAFEPTETRTIPVNFEPESKELRESDLNYFDELIFQDSLDKFNSHEVNKPREVHLDPAVIMSKEQTMENDLNFIDKTYFNPLGAEEITLDKSPEKDVQTMSISEDPKLTSEASKSLVDKRSKSSLKSNLPSVEESLQKKTDLKEAKNIEKVLKTTKKKDKLRLSTEGTALEYVRKLRKMSNSSQTNATHPSEMLGKHLQDRMIAATSNLAENNVGRGAGSEEEEGEEGQVVNYTDVKKYKPPDLEKYLRGEVRDLLLSKIIYNDHDIVAIWKPYGLPMFPNSLPQKRDRYKIKYSMECFLPDIAAKVGCEKLYEIHRLDSTTTGVVLYAKTKDMELKLRKLFSERKVKKNYLAICNGTPQTESGILDIPIGDAKVGDRVRKTLRPDYNSSKIITNKKSSSLSSDSAVTEYTTLATQGNASFVSTQMQSGRKHQIRIHLGLGLGTPILGDHKYSYATQLGKPQKVMGDILERLNLKKSKSRHLPIYLHARRITIPEILPDGNNLVIVATLPHFFSKTLSKLKLKSKKF